MRKTDQDWEQFGKTDPYYAVLTEAAYHRGNLDATTRSQFFESGYGHIKFVLDTIRQHFDPSFRPLRAVDFGCGVGRLLVPLADECQAVVGLDVSVSMLREARANLAARKIANVLLMKSDDGLALPGAAFDLVHSYIVLQHIPVARGEQLFARLVDLLRAGGIGALHLTYLRLSSRIGRMSYQARSSSTLVNGVANLRRGLPFRLPMMQMNEYDLNRIVRLLHDKGCRDLYLHPTIEHHPRMSIYGCMVFFQKGRPDDEPRLVDPA